MAVSHTMPEIRDDQGTKTSCLIFKILRYFLDSEPKLIYPSEFDAVSLSHISTCTTVITATHKLFTSFCRHNLQGAFSRRKYSIRIISHYRNN